MASRRELRPRTRVPELPASYVPGNWRSTFVTGSEIGAMLVLYARPKSDQTNAKVEEPAQPPDRSERFRSRPQTA